MKATIAKLERLLGDGQKCISEMSETEFSDKPQLTKWSKKEILGHLIDSALNNLQRFTEVQFMDQPFKVIPYNQDQLVKANDYQNVDTQALLVLWVAINQQLIHLINLQNITTLSYSLEFPDGRTSDLRFLINDYVDHLEHHLHQIKS